MGNSLHKNKGFHYKTMKELQREGERYHLSIPQSDRTDFLFNPICLKNHKIPNRFVSLPMEGCDAKEGSPSDLTFRKYEKIARGGAGIIWLEAVSVSKDGRSNPGQLMLTEKNVDDFKQLKQRIVHSAQEEFGDDHIPFTIIQLNHSGRYCKTFNDHGFLESRPIFAHHNEVLDPGSGVQQEDIPVSDDYLKDLVDKFLQGARLAKEAGFDGVDIKACHGYLLSELFSGFNREGAYGGDFDHRVRLYLEIIDAIQKDPQCEGLEITTRINMADWIPYPNGWGMAKDGFLALDLEEPFQLVEKLKQRDIRLISLTMGNPYHFAHVNKPYDKGAYVPEEEPIVSASRLLETAALFQREFPDIYFVGVGYSWFRHLIPQVAAGALENKMIQLIGLGREMIAYPYMVRDLKADGEVQKNKVCIACSKCSEMKSKIGLCGCVVRDYEVYGPIYLKMKEKEKAIG
ncbi:MAG: flavin oxidoreductase/NADH oxidase [Tissierellia bacterium]|nr:flavin oxidoreductase/NADH oxidase [Tissierellia bacterium]